MNTLVNGVASNHISLTDRGFQYGDGVFETVVVRRLANFRGVNSNKGVEKDVCLAIECWGQHFARLVSGLERLGFYCNSSLLKQQIETDIVHLLTTCAEQQAVLKIIVTRGGGGRGYLPPQSNDNNPTCTNRITQLLPWPMGRELLAQEGIRVLFCQHRWSSNSTLAGIKHLNRLDQVIARQEWQQEQYHEGLMLNQAGNIQSGVMSNLFVQRGSNLYTPVNDMAGINGIMAQQVMTVSQQIGIHVYREEISCESLQTADAVFLTNSLNRIWPVVCVTMDTGKTNNIVLQISPMVRDLQRALSNHLATNTRRI